MFCETKPNEEIPLALGKLIHGRLRASGTEPDHGTKLLESGRVYENRNSLV